MTINESKAAEKKNMLDSGRFCMMILLVPYLFFIPSDLGWPTAAAVILVLIGIDFLRCFICRVFQVNEDLMDEKSPYSESSGAIACLSWVAFIAFLIAYNFDFLPIDFQILARRDVQQEEFWQLSFYVFWGVYILMLPILLAALSTAIMILNDRRKFKKIFTDERIQRFTHGKDVFRLLQLFEGLLGVASITEETLRKISPFVNVNSMLARHFITIKGDLPESSYDSYCMPMGVYSQLKTELDEFLHGAGTHDIVGITKNTTGFVLKAYFVQKALNDLVASGRILRMEIGTAPGKEQHSGEVKYIYQHKNTQKPMKSREIKID